MAVATIADLATNFGTSSIAGGAGGAGTPLFPTDTIIWLATGTGTLFSSPSSGQTCRLYITQGTAVEICIVTARSGDQLTVQRGQEGTAARLWAVGATVQSSITAQMLANLWAAINNTRRYNVKDYGAVGDGVLDRNAAISSGGSTLSSTSSPGPFSAALVGRSVIVRGAGASGVDLWATISTFTDTQHVTLSTTAGTTVSGAMAFVVNTDDFSAFQSAFNAAVAAGGGTVEVPEGVYYTNYLNNNNGLQVTAGVNIRIVGRGRDSTFLVTSGAAASAGSCFASVVSGGTLAAEDFTIIGPATPNGVYSRALWHQGGSGRLTARRVVAWSFGSTLEADTATAAGTLDMVVDQCDLTTHATLNLGGAAVNANDYVRLSLWDSNIHDFGVASVNQNHGCYIHPSVDLDMSRCRFWNQRGTGWSTHIFTSSPVGASNNCSVQDCFYDTTTYQGVLTNAQVRTRLDGCRFSCSFISVTIQNDADVLGCQFEGIPSGQNYVKQSSGVTAATFVLFRDCTFTTPATTGTQPIWNNNSTNANQWKVTHCRFTCNQSAAVVTSSPSQTYLWDNDYADDGFGHHSTFGGAAVTLASVNANITSTTVQSGSNDVRGAVSFNVGTSIGSASALFTVTFAGTFAVAPIVTLTNANGALLGMTYGVVVTTTGFTVYNGSTLAVLSNYKVNYRVDE